MKKLTKAKHNCSYGVIVIMIMQAKFPAFYFPLPVHLYCIDLEICRVVKLKLIYLKHTYFTQDVSKQMWTKNMKTKCTSGLSSISHFSESSSSESASNSKGLVDVTLIAVETPLAAGKSGPEDLIRCLAVNI